MPLIRNFGWNVVFWPKLRRRPSTDEDVLEILRKHRGRRIRCVGALHSWSRILESPDVLIDMRRFDSVGVVTRGVGPDGEGAKVRLGAGCTIKRALDLLEPHGLTLPTIGAITKQTIGGAISTGTHGSGQPSLSHFVEEVRIAGYDPDSGAPCILRLRGREDLLAARCALGGLGVILDVVLGARADYYIEEHFLAVDSAEEARAGRDQWPLQQFFLIPWKWRYYVYRRRHTKEKPQPWWALWRRLRLLICVDVVQHAALKWVILPLAVIVRHWLKRAFLRIAGVPRYQRVDHSRHVLTLRHDLFSHVEMEVFVPETALAAAMDAVRAFIEIAAGLPVCPGSLGAALRAKFPRLHGRWTHHYPVSFRYVLPDDTLISMASRRSRDDTEGWVAISFFNYGWPRSRRFAAFAEAVAAFFVEEFHARLHWGKYFPIAAEKVARSYPRLREFEEIRRRYDPTGVFWSENLWPRGRR